MAYMRIMQPKVPDKCGPKCPHFVVTTKGPKVICDKCGRFYVNGPDKCWVSVGEKCLRLCVNTPGVIVDRLENGGD